MSDHVIKARDGPFKGSTTPMVDLGTYTFKILNTGEIMPGKLFTGAYVKKLYELEHVCTATKQWFVILYVKYEKSYLHNILETQCQQFTITHRN